MEMINFIKTILYLLKSIFFKAHNFILSKVIFTIKSLIIVLTWILYCWIVYYCLYEYTGLYLKIDLLKYIFFLHFVFISQKNIF